MNIKIRAWNELQNEMVTEENSGLKNYQILERFTNVMLCSGLTDINGQDIYEGDIITAYYKYIHSKTDIKVNCKVLFINGSFMVEHKHPEYGLCFRYLAGLVDNKNQVVGNIYENPSLITD